MLRKLFALTYRLTETLPSLRLMLIAAMGLGLGIGMSLVVFQNPTNSFASPAIRQAATRLLSVTELELSFAESEFLSRVVVCPAPEKNCRIVETEDSAGLAKGLVVLQVKDALLIEQLEKARLGDKLILIGSNNGRYSYQVIESRIANSEILPVLLDLHESGVVLYAKKGLTKSETIFVVAK